MGLENHPMDLEFEKYYSVLGVGATKNRNAGFISWKDGVHLHQPEFFATGFSLKRIAESKIAKDTQKEVIEMWVKQKTEEEITKRSPAAVESAAANPPAATKAITHAGSLAISGLAKTIISRSI